MATGAPRIEDFGSKSETMLRTATLLADARKQGIAIARDDVYEPATIEEAYAIQAEVTRLAGHDICGFKVGSTSKEAQKLLGTSEPGSAPVMTPYLFESPARLAVVPDHMPAIEGEFAFRLGQDLPPRAEDYTRDDLIAAIDAVAGAIEVVGTRIAGGLAGRGRFYSTADGGVNIALVTGAWHMDWRGLDLPSHAVSVTVNGKEKGQGTGARALGDPLNVMIWLANQQSTWNRGLKAGEIVSTGTCTGITGIKSGDALVADFGLLGTVEISVE